MQYYLLLGQVVLKKFKTETKLFFKICVLGCEIDSPVSVIALRFMVYIVWHAVTYRALPAFVKVKAQPMVIDEQAALWVPIKCKHGDPMSIINVEFVGLEHYIVACRLFDRMVSSAIPATQFILVCWGSNCRLLRLSSFIIIIIVFLSCLPRY